MRRETWEEAGLRTGIVRYVASQPWPFPGSLMIGCIAEARTTTSYSTHRTGSGWFSREEALQMLEGKHPDNLFCPPHMAIANTILKAWAVDGDTSSGCCAEEIQTCEP